MLALITLPESAVTTTLAYVGTIFTDLGPFVWIALGVPFAFYIVRKVAGILPKR